MKIEDIDNYFNKHELRGVMESQLNYTLEQKIKIKEHTLSRIPSSLEKFGQYIFFSTREISSNQRSLVFKMIEELEGEDANVDIEFILDTDYIYEGRLSLYEKPRGINRYALKYFALSLIQGFIARDHDGELKNTQSELTQGIIVVMQLKMLFLLIPKINFL